MIELLTTYTVTQVIVFLFIIALAAQESIKLIEFFYARAKQHFTGIEAAPSTATIQQIQKTLDLLIASDKDDIKSWIVQQYQYLKKHPEDLNEMMMDCLERRYSHYKAEGGNTYIDQLMGELRIIHKEAK